MKKVLLLAAMILPFALASGTAEAGFFSGGSKGGWAQKGINFSGKLDPVVTGTVNKAGEKSGIQKRVMGKKGWAQKGINFTGKIDPAVSGNVNKLGEKSGIQKKVMGGSGKKNQSKTVAGVLTHKDELARKSKCNALASSKRAACINAVPKANTAKSQRSNHLYGTAKSQRRTGNATTAQKPQTDQYGHDWVFGSSGGKVYHDPSRNKPNVNSNKYTYSPNGGGGSYGNSIGNRGPNGHSSAPGRANHTNGHDGNQAKNDWGGRANHTNGHDGNSAKGDNGGRDAGDARGKHGAID